MWPTFIYKKNIATQGSSIVTILINHLSTTFILFIWYSYKIWLLRYHNTVSNVTLHVIFSWSELNDWRQIISVIPLYAILHNIALVFHCGLFCVSYTVINSRFILPSLLKLLRLHFVKSTFLSTPAKKPWSIRVKFDRWILCCDRKAQSINRACDYWDYFQKWINVGLVLASTLLMLYIKPAGHTDPIWYSWPQSVILVLIYPKATETNILCNVWCSNR